MRHLLLTILLWPIVAATLPRVTAAQTSVDPVVIGIEGDGGTEAMGRFLRRRIPTNDSLWSEALRIHYDAVVLDGHLDTPERMLRDGYDFALRHRAVEAHVDLPRMREGGLDGGFFSIYVPTGYGEGGASVRRAEALIREVKRQVGRSRDAEFAVTASDVVRIARSGRRAVLIGLEGGHSLGGRLDRVDSLREAGIRYVTLTHVRPNRWGDASQAPPRWNGLSDDGRTLVHLLNDAGILVDLSHVSDSTFFDAVAESRAPVILSHSSARALTDHVRNASDDMLRSVAGTGGVVLVNFYEPLVKQPGKAGSLEDVLRHIEHVARVAGVDHVGLGSDFDGARMPAGLEDVTRLPWITHGLLKRGYSERDVRKILGGNLLRALRDAEESAEPQRGR